MTGTHPHVSGTVLLCGVSDEEERVRYYDTSLRDCTILACQISLRPLGRNSKSKISLNATALHSLITYVFTEKMCHTYRFILISTVVLNASFNLFFFFPSIMKYRIIAYRMKCILKSLYREVIHNNFNGSKNLINYKTFLLWKYSSNDLISLIISTFYSASIENRKIREFEHANLSSLIQYYITLIRDLAK